MSQSIKPVKEYDADKEFGAAIKALREAAWHMQLASYAVYEEVALLPPGTSIPSPYEGGAIVASGELLAAQIDALGTQVRKLRKRAKNF
jgi:hypothetical protein